jgi:hypothetical protein
MNMAYETYEAVENVVSTAYDALDGDIDKEVRLFDGYPLVNEDWSGMDIVEALDIDAPDALEAAHGVKRGSSERSARSSH